MAQESNEKPWSGQGESKLGVGIAIGAGIGAAIGAAIGNMGVGLSIGIAIGVVLGVALTQSGKYRRVYWCFCVKVLGCLG